MPTNRRRRKEDEGISPFMDPAFRRASVYFDDIEYQRRFEQNLIRYGILSKSQVTKEITLAVGGGGGGAGAGWCYWTKEGSNLIYYEGNVGVGVHPHSNDFEVRGNILVEAVNEQPYVEIRNWSDTDTQDPVIHWSVGATPAKKFTMGVDDSDSDAWLLCSGDILTSVVTDAIYQLSYGYNGRILIADYNNHRLHVYLHSTGARVVSAGTGSLGSGDDEFSFPWSVCNDGVHAYITEIGNDRIQKRLLSDLSFVAKVGSLGTGDDQFKDPKGICTDGTYLYIAEMGGARIQKRLCLDLSYVSKTSVVGGGHNFAVPAFICTDGTYLYIAQNGGATAMLIILTCASLAPVIHIHDDGSGMAGGITGICVRGGFLYISQANNPAVLMSIYKYRASTLSFVSRYLAGGSIVHTEVYMLWAIDTDGTNLYVWNDHNASNNPQEVQVRLLDGTWVSEFGEYGTTVDRFYRSYGISLCGTVASGETIPYRAPILKAGLDGSYVDSYPVHRFRDQIQLMEDGVVAATKYIGINAPAAITASYNITLPAAVPAAIGHFAISTAGVVTWGQNVGTTGTPTFVRIASLSVATGTAPITVTSTTVCTNLNAGMVDGVHIATLSVGAIPYASSASNLAALAAVAAGSYLRSNGVTTAPLWSTLKLPNAATAFRLPVATSANTIGEVAAVGATGEYLAGATGAIPAWATLNQAAVAGLTTADSPSFVALTLTQADGVAPLTITSTTIVANLNVDTVDGYHHDQSLLIAASPTFVRLTLSQAVGTAPLVVTSTTMVANLNADLLDGEHAAAFAAVGHNHDGVYAKAITKADTGDPASASEHDICINTFDNNVKIYAEGVWRQLATW